MQTSPRTPQPDTKRNTHTENANLTTNAQPNTKRKPNTEP